MRTRAETFSEIVRFVDLTGLQPNLADARFKLYDRLAKRLMNDSCRLQHYKAEAQQHEVG